MTVNWGGITISVKGTAGAANSVTHNAGFIQLENNAAGQLVVNSNYTIGNGGINVRAGNQAQLAVGGDFAANGGTLTVLQQTGEFAKVDIAGDLTMASAFTLATRPASGETFGLIEVSGTVNLGNAKFSPYFLDQYDVFASKILIIHNDSSSDTVGVFGNATFDVTTYTLGTGTTQDYVLRRGDYDSDGYANDIYLEEVIPEPATINLIVVSGISTFFIRRKMRLQLN